jgi:hypothetical protein
MDPTTILKTATVLLALTALGGLTLAGIRFTRDAEPPAWLAMVHGLIAGAALTLLIYAAFTVGIPTLALWATVLFVLAAIGGVVLNLGYHWHHRPLPKGLILGHAAIAVIGFVMLAVAAFGGRA